MVGTLPLQACLARQTRSRSFRTHILFLYFFFLMASVTSRSPLSILNVPRRPPVEKKSPFARRRRFGGGLLYSTFLRRARRVLTGSSINLVVSSPILRLHLHLSVHLPHNSSECRVLLYRWARPTYPSVRFSFGLGCTTTTSIQTRVR